MANILNWRAIFLQIWKQYKAEAEAFGTKSLKLQCIDGLFESRKFEKVKRKQYRQVCTKEIF